MDAELGGLLMKLSGAAALAVGMCLSATAQADVIAVPGTGQCVTALPRDGRIREWSPIALSPCSGGPAQQFIWTGKSYQYAGDSALCIGWHKLRDTEVMPLALEFCTDQRTVMRPDPATGLIYGVSPAMAAARCWVKTPPHATLSSTIGMGACGTTQFRAGTVQQAMALQPQPSKAGSQPATVRDVITNLQAIGPWTIQKSYRAGRFHRCQATLGTGQKTLILVKPATRDWGMAVASRGLAPGSTHTMELTLGRTSQSLSAVIDPTGGLLTSPLPDDVLTTLRGSSRLQITTPHGPIAWTLADVSAAVRAVEECFRANIGNAL